MPEDAISIENITPVQIRQVEQVMNPLQATMNQARNAVISVEEYLLKAGVTSEQIKAAADAAGEKAKLEYEEKLKEDPLNQIKQVLTDAAETDEERILVAQGTEKLENFRSGWRSWIEQKKSEAKARGEKFDLRTAVAKARKLSEKTPSFVNDRTDTVGNLITDHPSVIVLDKLLKGETRIEPSTEFRERFLRKIGVLPPEQTLEDLKTIPYKQGGPVYRPGKNWEFTEYIPAKSHGLEGFDFRVDFKAPIIYAYMDIPRLEKVTSVPPS